MNMIWYVFCVPIHETNRKLAASIGWWGFCFCALAQWAILLSVPVIEFSLLWNVLIYTWLVSVEVIKVIYLYPLYSQCLLYCACCIQVYTYTCLTARVSVCIKLVCSTGVCFIPVLNTEVQVLYLQSTQKCIDCKVLRLEYRGVCIVPICNTNVCCHICSQHREVCMVPVCKTEMYVIVLCTGQMYI